MRKLFSAAAIGLAAITLGGCFDLTTKEGRAAAVAQSQAVAKASLDIICTNAPTADAAFQVAVSTGKIKQSVINAERQAIAAINAVCASPPSDVASALRTAAAAFAAVIAAQRQAEAATIGS